MKIKWLVLLSLCSISGCASFLQGDLQALQIQTKCGVRVVPSSCTVQNSKGVWQVSAPGHALIKRDIFPLQVSCHAPFFGVQHVTVSSALHALTAGNALIGGVFGVGWDVYTRAGMAYPGAVVVQFPEC